MTYQYSLSSELQRWLVRNDAQRKHENDLRGRGLMAPLPTALAVDPGGTTGLAWGPLLLGASSSVLDERLIDMLAWGQITGTEEHQARMIVKGALKIDARVIIVESSDHFLLKAGSNLSKSSLIPVRIGAMVRGNLELLRHDGSVRWGSVIYEEQTPAMTKGVFSKARMAALGLSLGHADRHSEDALKHLLMYFRRLKEGKVTMPPGVVDEAKERSDV